MLRYLVSKSCNAFSASDHQRVKILISIPPKCVRNPKVF